MAETNLRAGFTGNPKGEKEGLAARAKDAAGVVKRETGAVAAVVQDHPAATGTALLVAGLVGVALGYLLATSTSEPPRSRFW